MTAVGTQTVRTRLWDDLGALPWPAGVDGRALQNKFSQEHPVEQLQQVGAFTMDCCQSACTKTLCLPLTAVCRHAALPAIHFAWRMGEMLAERAHAAVCRRRKRAAAAAACAQEEVKEKLKAELQAGQKAGDADVVPTWAGSGVGLVTSIEPAEPLVRRIAAEATEAIRELQQAVA